MSVKLKIIKTGSRASHLALEQVGEIQTLLHKHKIDLCFKNYVYETQGDKDKKTALTKNKIDDFFTDALDMAVLNDEIDIAIHSAKDVPQNIKEGLSVFALTSSLDDTDAFIGKVRFHKLKKGARVGTSSLIRQRSAQKLNPKIKVLDIRGSIEERVQLMEEGKYDGIIVATAALKRLGLEKKIQDIMPWESAPLQGQLAVIGRTKNKKLRDIFSKIDARQTYGKVYLVGAGPGDPELITLKGIKTLNKADCVFYDYLADKNLLDHAPKAEKIFVGKRKGKHTFPQETLSKLLRQKAIEGKTVARLKGGDPLIFGRGADEQQYLRAYHVKVDVIPGVSSATSIPSSLGIPLTARGISSSVAFVSGHKSPKEYDDTVSKKTLDDDMVQIPRSDTLVFLMGLTKLGVIIKSLRKESWKDDTPMVVISKGTCQDEKIVLGTLSDIEHRVKEQNIEPPALIIAGETIKFFDKHEHSLHGDQS